MTRRKQVILASAGAILVAGVAGVYLAGRSLVKHFEPMIRAQAIAYLRERFDSEVELKSLRIAIPALSPKKTFWNKGQDYCVADSLVTTSSISPQPVSALKCIAL